MCPDTPTQRNQPSDPPKTPRFFRLLLYAYPRRFRESWGEDLTDFWSSQRSENRYRGVMGRIRFTISILSDALAGSTRLRFSGRLDSQSSRYRGPASRSGEPLANSIYFDLCTALRSLRGAPLFSLVVLATLGLGIGATTAVFSVVESVVLRPLSFPQPEDLVLIPRTLEEGKTRAHSWPDFRDYRDQAAGFAELTAYYETEGTFEWEGGAESLSGAGVAREFFEVMGIQPHLGRTFSQEEDRMGGPKAVILSFGLWMSRFDGDRNVLGQTVPMDGEQVPVVGVMPESFSFPSEQGSFWVPLREDELLAEVGLPTGGRTLNFLQVLGRVDPTVGLQAAEARLRALAQTIDHETGKPEELYTSPRLLPLQQSLVGDTDVTLFLLLASAGLVLVVACANVAGLSFSRANMRRRELAVRAALGADRARLLRQLLTESLVLAAGAGVLGIGLAFGLQASLLTLAPPGLSNLQSGLPFNAVTVSFVGSITLVAGLLFGFFPALRASGITIVQGLAGGRGASGHRGTLRPQQVLVSVQVSLAVILLVGAVLLTSSLLRLSSVDRGFQTEAVVLASIDPGTRKYDTSAKVDGFYRELLDHVRAHPGVIAASTTYSPPLAGNDFWTTVTPEGSDRESVEPTEAGMVIIRDGYFNANGIPLMDGRDFGPQDRLGEPLVAIVNETMAELLWPGEDPIGKRFSFAGGVRGSAETFDEVFFPGDPYTVIGLAGDVRRTNLASIPGPEYYRPQSQVTWAFQYLVVQTSSDKTALAQDLRSLVWSVDPSVPVRTVTTLYSTVRDAVALERFRVFLIGGFAGVTCFLAMVGLYAVMALMVARRSKELGIRLALGAKKDVILRDVLTKGLRLVGAGILAGVTISLAAGRVLSSMLYEIRPSDPATYLVVVALVGVVALGASLFPALRAAKVDPIKTLREE